MDPIPTPLRFEVLNSGVRTALWSKLSGMMARQTSGKDYAAEKEPTKGALNVLIVEDSEFDAQMFIRLLEEGGYTLVSERVETATAMEAALLSRQWDLVLSDYNMPDFNAPGALKLMKAKGFDLPFIIISGGIGEDIAVAAMKAGAHDYLMKGNLHRLLPAVERELREARWRARKREAERSLMDRLNAVATGSGAVRAAELKILVDVWNGTRQRTHEECRVEPPKPGLANEQINTGSQEDVATKLGVALAQFVGGFCHDAGNDIIAAQNALDEKCPASYVSLILSRLRNSLTDLHQFTKQFYKDDQKMIAIRKHEIKTALIEMLPNGLVSNKISLSIRCKSLSEKVMLPRILVRHLVVPLVINAFEACSADRPSKCRPKAVNVIIEMSSTLGEVLIRIVDSGPGWPKPAEVLFEGIRRAKPSSTKGANRGYGLHNVYRISERLGGVMLLLEGEDGGACVEIRIPWKDRYA